MVLAPPGLNAGLLVSAENVIAWPQRCTFPTAQVKVKDETSLAGKLWVAWEYAAAMMPGPQRVLAEPTSEGGATDLRDDAARNRLLAQFGA